MDFKDLIIGEVSISAIVAGSIRYMITSTKRSLKEILFAIVIAWVVAKATHPIILEICNRWNISEDSSIGITGVVAFLAPDLLYGLLNFGKTIREEGIISAINRFRK